jgi:hypothetical protein
VSDYSVILTNATFGLVEVRLYEDTISHIREHHPEVPILLPCIASAVTNAIANPTHVEGSYGGSFVFVDANTTDASGDPLRIPVKPIEGNSGRVRTVYFAASGSSPNIVWRRS